MLRARLRPGSPRPWTDSTGLELRSPSPGPPQSRTSSYSTLLLLLARVIDSIYVVIAPILYMYISACISYGLVSRNISYSTLDILVSQSLAFRVVSFWPRRYSALTHRHLARPSRSFSRYCHMSRFSSRSSPSSNVKTGQRSLLLNLALERPSVS